MEPLTPLLCKGLTVSWTLETKTGQATLAGKS
jgi:hypothetical protein